LLAERSDHLRFFAIEKVDELEGKLAYLESGALVAFILKRWGIEKFDLLFTYLDNPSNYVHPRGAIEGVERVLGLSFAEFERQWKEEYRVAEPAKNFAIRPPVAGDAGQEIGGAVDMLASGEQTYDFAALGALRQYFAVAMVQCPQNAQLQYYLARALFGLVNTPQGRDDPEFSRRCLEEAQKHTENFLVVEPQFSDAHRLLGEIFSSLIRFKGKMSVLKYGPRAEACLTKAVELDPQNPNAWLGLGRVKLFTPPLFGGGVEVAQKHFAKARELSPLRSDIIAWQGMAHYEARGIERAKKCFLFSLSLNPRDLLAQEMLTEINKEVCNAQ
jgi:tetratricopeptide (TPR) repeat protein